MIRYRRLSLSKSALPLGFYYPHRLVASPDLRRLAVASIAAFLRAARPASRPRRKPPPEGIGEFRRRGWLRLPALLRPNEIAEIRDFLDYREAVAYGTGVRSRVVDRETDIGQMYFATADILDCPHVLRVINDARVLDIADAYLGCRPTISSWGLRWSFPSGDAQYTQLYHRDCDDWRFFKLFVYLTDVDQESGPHMMVEGSHRTKASIRARYLSDEEVASRYSDERIVMLTGKAGTAFLVDTYAIHKGLMPKRAPRLVLQVQYSLLPNYALAYEPPLRVTSPGLDPYVNRLLVVGM